MAYGYRLSIALENAPFAQETLLVLPCAYAGFTGLRSESIGQSPPCAHRARTHNQCGRGSSAPTPAPHAHSIVHHSSSRTRAVEDGHQHATAPRCPLFITQFPQVPILVFSSAHTAAVGDMAPISVSHRLCLIDPSRKSC